jgi:hypothetical protein
MMVYLPMVLSNKYNTVSSALLVVSNLFRSGVAGHRGSVYV